MCGVDIKIRQKGGRYKIMLKDDAAKMEDVVVTGYRTISKTRMTGAAESITSEKIENKGFSVNSDELRRPLLVRGDIYYEANRSAIDTLTIMSSIADQYGNIINKPMRKNVELFIKEE